jgi:hypothetical protein
MAGGDGKAPVFEIVRAGIAFARSNFAIYLPAAAGVAVATALGRALTKVSAIPEAVSVVLAFAALLAELSFATFILRLAIHQDRSGLAGLKLGPDEGRVLVVILATFAIGILAGFVGLFVLSSAVTIAAQQSGVDLQTISGDREALEKVIAAQFAGQAAPLLWLVVAALFLAVAWIGARLSVAPAATVGERRVLILTTFPWTRGNAFRIIAALAPFQLLSLAPVLASGLLTGPVLTVFLGMLALNFVQLAFITPAMLGATAYLYRGFRPPDFR